LYRTGRGNLGYIFRVRPGAQQLSPENAIHVLGYRRAARIISPDISRTYADFLANKVAAPDEPDEFEEAIVEARVSIAALGLVMEVQAYFDGEADKLAKAWLAKFGNAIKKLTDDRKEAYRQVAAISNEPQEVELVKPEAKFEPTRVLAVSAEPPQAGSSWMWRIPARNSSGFWYSNAARALARALLAQH
jgi:hypothetical protein